MTNPFGLTESDMKRLNREGIEELIEVGEARLKRAKLTLQEKNEQEEEIKALKELLETCKGKGKKHDGILR